MKSFLFAFACAPIEKSASSLRKDDQFTFPVLPKTNSVPFTIGTRFISEFLDNYNYAVGVVATTSLKPEMFARSLFCFQRSRGPIIFSSVLLEALVVVGDVEVERRVLELLVVERVPPEAEDLRYLPLHRVVGPVNQGTCTFVWFAWKRNKT